MPNTEKGSLMADNEIRFDGRAIVVTGAGRGMGRDHALLLASRGAKVVVADNGSAMDGSDTGERPAESVVGEILAAGGEAVACTADLATEEGSHAAIQASIEAFGRIDGLLHNASTSPNIYTPDAVDSGQLDLVMRVNTYAAFWLTRAAWPYMQEQGYGRIVYVASHSIYGVSGSAAYASAKSSYIGLARANAITGAPMNILTNIVAPTAYTRMTARMPESDYADWLARTFNPTKVALGIAYLLSEECEYRGEMFSIGGGRLARIRLAETEGLVLPGESLEDMREAFATVMSQDTHFYPREQQDRVKVVAKDLGYEGEIADDAYAVKDVSARG